MALKATESGKAFRYGTRFNMSAYTQLDLKFTAPSGTTFTISSTTGRVDAPSIAVNDPDVGGLNADEYMEFLTEATDFTETGTYTVCGTFTNTATTPDQIYYGDDASFTVREAC